MPRFLGLVVSMLAAAWGGSAASRPILPTAKALADTWRPYIETRIDAFGAARCMFESNFPPDHVAGSYWTLWNALKLTAARCMAGEQGELFAGTACRVYGIQ